MVAAAAVVAGNTTTRRVGRCRRSHQQALLLLLQALQWVMMTLTTMRMMTMRRPHSRSSIGANRGLPPPLPCVPCGRPRRGTGERRLHPAGQLGRISRENFPRSGDREISFLSQTTSFNDQNTFTVYLFKLKWPVEPVWLGH